MNRSANRLLLIAIACWLTKAEALAQERATARLQYSVHERAGCPNEQTFRDIVAGRLGYDPFQNNSSLAIQASIAKRGNTLIGGVRVTNAKGVVTGARDIEAPAQDCQELATSMAIAISILLDPFGTAAQRASEPTQAAPKLTPSALPEPPAAAPLPKSPPPTQAERQEKGPRVGLVVHGNLAGAYGLAPGMTLGPIFGVGARIARLSVLLEGRVDFMPADAMTGSGDRVEATIFTAGPSGCFAFGVGLACSSLQFGTFQGRGLDVVDSGTQSSFFASVDVRGGLDVPLGKVFSFRALPEIRIPIVRTSLTIEDVTVWNAGPLAGGLILGLGATFL